MRIQLKQPEIEEAIGIFLSEQGIDVYSKIVTMEFTAGRKNKGISVEVLVEEATIPPEELVCVPCTTLEIQDGVIAASQSDLGSAEPAEEAKDPNPDATHAEEAQPAPTTSLFG